MEPTSPSSPSPGTSSTTPSIISTTSPAPGTARSNDALCAAIEDVPALRVAAWFSLSHKRFGVSYCEIRRARVHGTVLRAAVTSADLGYTGLAERSISRCGTHQALCDRLSYAGLATTGLTSHAPGVWEDGPAGHAAITRQSPAAERCDSCQSPGEAYK